MANNKKSKLPAKCQAQFDRTVKKTAGKWRGKIASVYKKLLSGKKPKTFNIWKFIKIGYPEGYQLKQK
ncbi:MAG: hypothetical protein ACYDA4_15245 [Ignavibacteriaceae bacterium]